MQDRLFIRMLTGGDLLVEAPVPIQWKGRAARTLLTLLALQPGEPVSRDRLAGLLWPESDQKSARGSLRMALHSLRDVLDLVDPDLICATNESIMLDVERDAVDWALFENLCARPDAESRLRALDLYMGDLLAALPAPSEAVTELLRDEGERLRDIAIETGLDLIASFEDIGERDQIGSIVRKILTIEPANEPAHQAMMRAHAAAGDRSAALRQYEQCCEALDEHYDLGPSAETIALRNEITGTEVEEPAEPTAQSREFTNEEAALFVQRSDQRERPRWRRLVPAAFAFATLALALLVFWPRGDIIDPPFLPVIVLSLEFDEADPNAEAANEIRNTFEETLRRILSATVITQADPDKPPDLRVDSYLISATVIHSSNRLRIFVELRDSGSLDPFWQGRQDFGIYAYERLAGWLEAGLIPVLRSKIDRESSPK